VPDFVYPEEVARINIDHCRFSGGHVALAAGGGALRHVHIVDNEFATFAHGISFADYIYDRVDFRFQDSVITDNRFISGSYKGCFEQRAHPRCGPIATSLAGSHRVDFSRILTDGRRPQEGWRASHFWNLGGGDQEKMLVSQNRGYCTSDRAGDGEMLSFDGAGQDAGFRGAADVISVSGNRLTVNKLWRLRFESRYKDHWLAIVSGPGVDQARRIQEHSGGKTPTIVVTPDWDVPPQAGLSKVVALRAYWSIYSVANRVDNRLATGANPQQCAGTNPFGKDGVLTYYGATFDSTFENNTQFNTDGYQFNARYFESESIISNGDRYYVWHDVAPYFGIEVRSNYLNGEYEEKHGDSLGRGGIWIQHANFADEYAPIIGFNITLADNRIIDADTAWGEGIGLRTQTAPPATHGWMETAIDRNRPQPDREQRCGHRYLRSDLSRYRPE